MSHTCYAALPVIEQARRPEVDAATLFWLARMHADGVDLSGIPELAFVEDLERALPRRTDEAARAAGTALSPDELVRLLCGTGLDIAVRLAEAAEGLIGSRQSRPRRCTGITSPPCRNRQGVIPARVPTCGLSSLARWQSWLSCRASPSPPFSAASNAELLMPWPATLSAAVSGLLPLLNVLDQNIQQPGPAVGLR